MNTSRDNSTIDFAYMPSMTETTAQNDSMRMPLLPNNYNPQRESNPHHAPIESVTRPEISTVSADGTHIDSPSAMSEVTDNHALEMDVYDLTKKVSNAAAMKVTGMSVGELKEPSVAKQFFGGLLDDIFGPKKTA